MVTYLDSHVQLCCGEGGTLQTNTAGMCGECCTGWTTLGLPQPKAECISQDHTTQAPGSREDVSLRNCSSHIQLLTWGVKKSMGHF